MHIDVVLSMSKRIKQNCCAPKNIKVFGAQQFFDACADCVTLSIFKIVHYGADHTHLFDEGG